MTFEEAQQKVAEHLTQFEESLGSLVILHESTMDISCGWVFFYQSRKCLETGESRYALGGNAPILVDRRDGSLHETGTASRPEYYIQNYLETGDPLLEAVSAVELSGWHVGADKVEATRLINRSTDLGLIASKRCIDDALNDDPTVIDCQDDHSASDLASALQQMGWKAKVVRKAPGQVS